MFRRKRRSMLRDLKVSSLACKYVYFTEQDIMEKGEPYGFEF